MKLTTLIFLTFLFYVRTFGQQTISDLVVNAKEGTAELESIYDLDVFSYYNLNDYNSDLKQAVFKKTEEYQNKLTELKSTKAEMLKTTYYVKLEKAFGDSEYGSVNYDIKRKGFEIVRSEEHT